MRNKFLVALVAAAGALVGCAAPRGQFAVVIAPAADVRSKPGYLPTDYHHDDEQETQLLLGETVRIDRTQGDWALIEAVEQDEHTHHDRWEGYPGWALNSTLKLLPKERRDTATADAVITAKWAPAWLDAALTEPAEPLPMGATVTVVDDAGEQWSLRLPAGDVVWVARASVGRVRDLIRLTAEERRRRVLVAAQEMVGDPYLWGGRSPHDNLRSLPITGVDCSGLINLVYRTAGVRIPRDAHEQYLRARPVASPQPGDLVFLSSPDRPDRMTHVMLYAGNEELLEAPGTDERVRRISTHERFGRPLRGLRPGELVEGRRVFFGAYLP